MRLGGGSPSSWNKCESAQLWGSGKVVQGKIVGMGGKPSRLGRGLYGGDLRKWVIKRKAGFESVCVLQTGLKNRRQRDPEGWGRQAASSKARVGKRGEGRSSGREGVLLKREGVGFLAGGMGEGVRNGNGGLTRGC